MASETVERFIQTLQQIEQTGDVEPMVAMFTDDAELSNLATPTPLRGREGARKFWQKYLSVFGQIRSKFTHVVENNGVAVLEWISEGVLSSGEPLSYKGASALETDNEQVRCFRTYYDSAVFLPQGAKQ